MAYLFLLGTLIFNVYALMIVKWRLGKQAMPLGVDIYGKFIFFYHFFLDPFVISSFVVTFLGIILWISALSKFELSIAYPFMSLSYILIALLSAVFFHESLPFIKLLGLLLIMVGVACIGLA